jgi:hypothetical protein
VSNFARSPSGGNTPVLLSAKRITGCQKGK